MAITVNKISGPGVLSGYGHIVDVELTIGASGWLEAGNAVDLTSMFSEITSISVGGAEVINGYKFDFILPGDGVTVTTSNVLLTAHMSSATAIAMTPVVDDTDLSGITGLRATIVGKISASAY